MASQNKSHHSQSEMLHARIVDLMLPCSRGLTTRTDLHTGHLFVTRMPKTCLDVDEGKIQPHF